MSDVIAITEEVTHVVEVGGGVTHVVGVGVQGPAGPQGDPGEDGDPGPGVPAAGSAGDLIRKASGTDYATEWFTPTYVTSSQLTTALTAYAPLASPTFVSPVTVRQSGGTPGTDEVTVSHDGSNGLVKSLDGYLQLGGSQNGYLAINGTYWAQFNPTGQILLEYSGGGERFGLLGTYSITWGSGAEAWAGIDTGVKRAAAGVVAVTNGSTGGGQLEFPQVADVGAPSSNSARIGAEDVGGTAELIGSDEAGNETQLTPHAADAPPGLYDGDANEEVHRTINPFLGTVQFVNLTRLARIVDAIAAGNLAAVQALPAARRRTYYAETVAAYAARTGRAKQVRTWAAVQAAHQARYDAARASELERHAEWAAQPADVRGPEPVVRPVADVRKPLPKWLSDRGVRE